MKIWFSHCRLSDYTEENVKFGIGWYGHHRDYKWRGFSVHLYLLYFLVTVNIVDNYKEYDKRMNHKRDPDYLKKMGERLKAIRDKK